MISGSTLTIIKISLSTGDKVSTKVEKSQDRSVLQEKSKNLTNYFILMNLGTHMGLRLFKS